ncbi:M20 metallopeptidase family protein [Crocinitomix algicola]|uniref:M20 metallopeptidase family protein n=1 Tax=Crocinitomix algicola TaxID=1740263 RepID=UPI0008724232|nr:M20 family metallopeptidase [Crocinitomix algicola]
MDLKKLIKTESEAIFEEVVAIRRHIHSHPELSFKEFETSAFIAKKLSSWGIAFEDRIVETGIIALIEGQNSEDHCIGLRADMDALPIAEESNASYKSQNEGIMHACGHDVHTAILLGTAKILYGNRHLLKTKVKLIFQPGEEQLPGGANLMIKEGALENPKVDEIYALHVFPELEVGKVGLKEGMYMASCDEIRITVNGKGGHGAMPHQNIDPILIASHLIVSLQQVVSRNCPPTIPSVLSFGRIEGLGATNVIPDTVSIEGTFRTMNEEWRKEAHVKIKRIANHLVEGMGGTVDVDIQVGYPYLENDAAVTRKAKEKCISFFGEDNVVDLPLRMTGEDFAYYSQKIPATFIRIGVRNEAKGIIYPVHNKRFDIDENALKIGIQTLLSQVFI